MLAAWTPPLRALTYCGMTEVVLLSLPSTLSLRSCILCCLWKCFQSLGRGQHSGEVRAALLSAGELPLRHQRVPVEALRRIPRSAVRAKASSALTGGSGAWGMSPSNGCIRRAVVSESSEVAANLAFVLLL